MVLKKGTQKKKTSLNDGRCNFCLAQEFLDDQVNRVLDLVTKGVPGALSWKKVLMNWRFQVTDIHLPEGRVWLTSLCSCAGFYNPEDRAGLFFFHNSQDALLLGSGTECCHMTTWSMTLPRPTTQPSAIQELGRAAKQVSTFQQPHVDARAQSQQSLWL